VVNSIALRRVKYLPRELAPGILYVSEEFAVAGHLCACGCGNKIITPLGPSEWTFTERNGRPTLHPSVGNWQLPCRSHYIIDEGQIHLVPTTSSTRGRFTAGTGGWMRKLPRDGAPKNAAAKRIMPRGRSVTSGNGCGIGRAISLVFDHKVAQHAT
jgi:Family of unknown function (DUF6527)